MNFVNQTEDMNFKNQNNMNFQDETKANFKNKTEDMQFINQVDY